MKFLSAYIKRSLQPAKRMPEFSEQSALVDNAVYQPYDPYIPDQDKVLSSHKHEPLAKSKTSRAEEIAQPVYTPEIYDGISLTDNDSSNVQVVDNEINVNPADTDKSCPQSIGVATSTVDSDDNIEYRTIYEKFDRQPVDDSSAHIFNNDPPLSRDIRRDISQGLNTENPKTGIVDKNEKIEQSIKARPDPTSVDNINSVDDVNSRKDQLVISSMNQANKINDRSDVNVAEHKMDDYPVFIPEYVQSDKSLPQKDLTHQFTSFKPEPRSEEIPQVRIGHINVVIDDRSATKSKRNKVSPSTHSSNAFGLRGL